jgi:hypothetical protein
MLAGSVVAGPETRQPVLIDCTPDAVVLLGGQKVEWTELSRPTNAVVQLLQDVEAQADKEAVVVVVRPGSVKTYRAVRKLIGTRRVNVSYEAVDAGAPFPQLAPRRGGGFGTVPIYFECRGNLVCPVDFDGLQGQVDGRLAKIPGDRDPAVAMRTLQADPPIANHSYRVNINYLLMGVIALEPLPGQGAGMALEKLSDTFGAAIAKLDPDKHYVTLLVRDDSFPAFRKARDFAEAKGFAVGWELLATNEPIKFDVPGMRR